MPESPRFDEYRVSDAFWARLQAVLPTYFFFPKGRRPRKDLRHVMEGIFDCLRTGCQWCSASISSVLEM